MELPKEVENIIQEYAYSMQEYENRMVMHNQFYKFWSMLRLERCMREFRSFFYPDFIRDIIPNWTRYELVFLPAVPEIPEVDERSASFVG